MLWHPLPFHSCELRHSAPLLQLFGLLQREPFEVNGSFRKFESFIVFSNNFLCLPGLGDSWTPFLCAVFLNIINLWLDPIFIITSGLGAAGAAHVTTIAQTVALVPMLWILHRRVHVRFQYQIPKLVASLTLYFKAGMYLLGRTIARVAAFALCSRESVRRCT